MSALSGHAFSRRGTASEQISGPTARLDKSKSVNLGQKGDNSLTYRIPIEKILVLSAERDFLLRSTSNIFPLQVYFKLFELAFGLTYLELWKGKGCLVQLITHE